MGNVFGVRIWAKIILDFRRKNTQKSLLSLGPSQHQHFNKNLTPILNWSDALKIKYFHTICEIAKPRNETGAKIQRKHHPREETRQIMRCLQKQSGQFHQSFCLHLFSRHDKSTRFHTYSKGHFPQKIYSEKNEHNLSNRERERGAFFTNKIFTPRVKTKFIQSPEQFGTIFGELFAAG